MEMKSVVPKQIQVSTNPSESYLVGILIRIKTDEDNYTLRKLCSELNSSRRRSQPPLEHNIDCVYCLHSLSQRTHHHRTNSDTAVTRANKQG